jgi:hypothetical protein
MLLLLKVSPREMIEVAEERARLIFLCTTERSTVMIESPFVWNAFAIEIH